MLTPSAHRRGQVPGMVLGPGSFPGQGGRGAPAPHVLGCGRSKAAEWTDSVEPLPHRDLDAYVASSTLGR
eukprot:3146777-Pyramimonas_sp.AAC.1